MNTSRRTPDELAPDDTPQPNADNDADPVYLALSVTDEALSLELLSALENIGAGATFLFTEKELAESGDLLRRLSVVGSAVALKVDASAGGLGAPSPPSSARTTRSGPPATAKPSRPAGKRRGRNGAAPCRTPGYCPIVFDLDYSAGLPSVSRAVSAMQRATRGCTVLLGDDTSVQEDWTSLLTRLHANGLPITALNELSARGSAS